jgi:parvulin-like peptidyl-prolyl isomerase
VTRTTSRLAAAGFAVLLLAGCGGGGGETRAGAAATVGDQRITTEDLEAFVERGLADPQAEQQFGAERGEYQRQVLNRLVRAELLEQAAQDEDIEVSQGDVDAQIAEFAEQAGGQEQLEQQAAAGGINTQDLPRFAREVVLEMQLGDELTEDVEIPDAELQALYDENAAEFDQVGTRHILVEDEAQARDLLAQVQADPSRFPRSRPSSPPTRQRAERRRPRPGRPRPVRARRSRRPPSAPSPATSCWRRPSSAGT